MEKRFKVYRRLHKIKEIEVSIIVQSRVHPERNLHSGWTRLCAGKGTLPELAPRGIPARCPRTDQVAGISGRSAHPGGHSDLAGIPWLSPDPVYQGAEDAGHNRQGRRGQIPHRLAAEEAVRGSLSLRIHHPHRNEPLCQRQSGVQAGHGR